MGTDVVLEEVEWKVGKVVLVYLPYQRTAIGKIDSVDKESIHVMVHEHIMLFDKDGQDLYNSGHAGSMSIKIPTREELKATIIELRRKKLDNFDFMGLTDKQVKGIVKQMKSYGVKF